MSSQSFSAVPILQPFVDRQELAGAVTLVANRDEVLSLEAVGHADLAAQKPMTTDAMFWIASQTKPMTATALMMLVDEGLVDVEEPVEKYLPEFAGQMVIAEQDEEHRVLRKPIRPLLVRHVLSHTGGLPFWTPVEQPRIDGLSLEHLGRLYAMTALEAEPGSRYCYSNAGTNIAGRIVEVVSGQPYEEFLQERLLDPLGMTDTTFWPSAEQLDRLAKVYKPGPENVGLEEIPISQFNYPLDSPRRFAAPAGGLFSTASDVARFCRMILRGGELDGRRYVSEESVRVMTSRQTGDLETSYGFCWSVGEDSFGHGGAYSTNMTIEPKNDLVTVWLVQHAKYPGEGNMAQGAFRETAKAAFG